MTTMEQTRFAELRAKTDRDLARLIDRRLHFAVRCLLSGGSCRNAAEEVSTEAGALIPLIYGLPAKSRKRLESRLGQLRELLAQTAEEGRTRAFAAC